MAMVEEQGVKPNNQPYFNLILKSFLLAYCWPKQIMWQSLKNRSREWFGEACCKAMLSHMAKSNEEKYIPSMEVMER